MSPDVGAFLEVAVGVNLLAQWKAVFDFVAKVYLGKGDVHVDALPLLQKRDWALRWTWTVTRAIAVVSATAAYLALLCGIPPSWVPWFAPAVGLPVPIIMLVLLPLVANAFGLGAWQVSRRAHKREEEEAHKEEEFEKRFQQRFDELVSRGEIVVRRSTRPTGRGREPRGRG